MNALNITFATKIINGQVTAFASFTNRGVDYVFSVCNHEWQAGHVLGMTKRTGFSGGGTSLMLTERQFVEKYAKMGAESILKQLKENAGSIGHRVTDNEPMPG